MKDFNLFTYIWYFISDFKYSETLLNIWMAEKYGLLLNISIVSICGQGKFVFRSNFSVLINQSIPEYK